MQRWSIIIQEVAGLGAISFGIGLLWLATVVAQSPPVAPASPACEQQVQDQYRQLSADGLVAQGTAPQWGPQLTALATQVRTLRHQYDIKKNQAELAEQNVAQLLEQLRQAREALARPKPHPEAPPAAN